MTITCLSMFIHLFHTITVVPTDKSGSNDPSNYNCREAFATVVSYLNVFVQSEWKVDFYRRGQIFKFFRYLYGGSKIPSSQSDIFCIFTFFKNSTSSFQLGNLISVT